MNRGGSQRGHGLILIAACCVLAVLSSLVGVLSKALWGWAWWPAFTVSFVLSLTGLALWSLRAESRGGGS